MNSFKIRFRLLLIFSCICLVLLSLLQFYLIKNYFQLTKENFIEEVKEELKQVDINFPGKIDDDDAFLKIIKGNYELYKSGVIDKQTLLNTFKKDYDSLNHTNTENLELLKNKPFKDIQYKYEFTKVAIIVNGKIDSLIRSTDEPFLFYGTQFSNANAETLGSGNWIFDSEIEDDLTKEETLISLSFSYMQRFSVENWQQKVLVKMVGVLIVSCIIFLSVCLLFFYTFKSLLKQKKQNEITQDFADNITHELKTPIATIGLIGKTLNSNLNNKDKKTNLELLEKQISKLNRIVDRTLDSVQVDNFQPNLEVVNTDEFLSEYCNQVRLENHQFNCSLNSNVSIKMNKEVMISVLDNLIENAQKYSSENESILLKSYRENKQAVIEVVDNGIGISEENRAQIFERYFRVSNGILHKNKGLGLGLYLSKKAIEKMNGSLTVEPNQPKGSIFKIQIPTV